MFCVFEYFLLCHARIKLNAFQCNNKMRFFFFYFFLLSLSLFLLLIIFNSFELTTSLVSCYYTRSYDDDICMCIFFITFYILINEYSILDFVKNGGSIYGCNTLVSLMNGLLTNFRTLTIQYKKLIGFKIVERSFYFPTNQ